jgi:hypothetical protein
MKEALQNPKTFTTGATPAPAPVDFTPPPVSTLPAFAGAAVAGSFAWFLGMLTLTFADGYGMPLVLVICAICGVAYFGLGSYTMRMAEGRASDFADFMRRGIRTGSGTLSGVDALAQVLTLPLLLAAFATFVAIYV